MPQNKRSFRKKWTVALAVAAAVVLMTGTLLSLQSPCLVKEWIGIPCPGCGMTRAAVAFLQGDFAGVNRWNPMFWAVLPVVGYLIGCPFSRTLRTWVWLPLLLLGLGMVVCWGVRMALLFPATPPMDVNPDAWLIQYLQ